MTTTAPSPTTPVAADEAFWDRFVAEHWERRALELRGDDAVLPRVEADRLFAATVATVDRFRQGQPQKVRFYVEDGIEIDLLRGGHGDLLPTADDGSFEGYDRRLRRHPDVRAYALVVADWHQFDRVLWERLITALHPLLQRVGISPSRMDTQLFLGTYRVTPFGVHADDTSGFHVPVIGTKRMRLWPGTVADATPALRRARDYGPWRAQSTVIEAGPGEALYWPSHDWHVAESDGSFSVTWGCGYWFGDGLAVTALEEVGQRLLSAADAGAPIDLAATGAQAGETSPAVDALVERVRRAAADPAARSAIARQWLEHVSAFGFRRLPATVEASGQGDGGAVRLRPPFRFLTAPLAPGTMCVAAAGRSVAVAGGSGVTAAARLLNRGDPVDRRQLTAAAGDAGTVDAVVALGLGSGALDRVPATGPAT